MYATQRRMAGRDPVSELTAGNGHRPWTLPLQVLAFAGVTVLGAGSALAQTVSSRLSADVPRWAGTGEVVGERGLLSGTFGDSRMLGGTDGPASVVGGGPLGSIPSVAMAPRDLLASERSGPVEGLVGRALFEVGDWISRKTSLEMAQYDEPVMAPASGSAGGSSPLFVDVGTHLLARNQAGQWVTLTARNESSSAVVLSGLNFNVQIADSGPVTEGGFGVMDGPNITQVDLVTGTAFAANNTGTTAASGNVPQAGLWTVATLTGTISIDPGQTVTLARIQLDTSSFHGDESWSLSLTAGPPGGLQSSTSFVQVGTGGLVEATDIRFNPGMVMVPEPRWLGGSVGLGLVAWRGWCRLRRARTANRG